MFCLFIKITACDLEEASDSISFDREVVTICDRLTSILSAEPEYKILEESVPAAPDQHKWLKSHLTEFVRCGIMLMQIRARL